MKKNCERPIDELRLRVATCNVATDVETREKVSGRENEPNGLGNFPSVALHYFVNAEAKMPKWNE